MLVQRTQTQAGRFMPYVNKSTAKTAQKLKQISFDIRPNKLISEPYKDIYTKTCSSSGSYHSIGSCDDVMMVDVMSC